jgi:hypothetical protein
MLSRHFLGEFEGAKGSEVVQRNNLFDSATPFLDFCNPDQTLKVWLFGFLPNPLIGFQRKKRFTQLPWSLAVF